MFNPVEEVLDELALGAILTKAFCEKIISGLLQLYNLSWSSSRNAEGKSRLKP